MFTIWIEEIEKDMFFSPKEFPFGFNGDHLHIIDILEAESAEIALALWKTRIKYDEIRLDPRNNKDYLVQIDQKFYHVISNHGEIPKRIEDSLLDEDYTLNT